MHSEPWVKEMNALLAKSMDGVSMNISVGQTNLTVVVGDNFFFGNEVIRSDNSDVLYFNQNGERTDSPVTTQYVLMGNELTGNDPLEGTLSIPRLDGLPHPAAHSDDPDWDEWFYTPAE